MRKIILSQYTEHEWIIISEKMRKSQWEQIEDFIIKGKEIGLSNKYMINQLLFLASKLK